MLAGTGDPVCSPGIQSPGVAIIAALELESRILRYASRSSAASVHVSGPGCERAREAARHAIRQGARSLVAFGLAGGLEPGIRCGSVLLPAKVIGDAGEFAADAAWRGRWRDALEGHVPLVEGPLYSAGVVLTTPEAKAALSRRTGAVAVDMESAGVAEAAAAAGLPFLALRAIADTADDALPEGADRLVTAAGKTAWRELLPFLVSPRALGLLIRLGLRSRRARAQLGRALGVLGGSRA
jgi:adenosylhomocysteine nucleosidase